MKKFLLLVVFLILATIGTAAYLMLGKPESPAGQWVKSQYDAYVLPHLPESLTQKGVPAPAESEAQPVDTAAAATLPNDVADAPAAPVVPVAEVEASDSSELEQVVSEVTLAVPPTAEAQIADPKPVKKAKPFSKENWYSGKVLAASDIRGKTVLVYVWDANDPRSVAMLARVQQTWNGFKHKPFTLIGSHRGERSAKVQKALKAQKVTFPVYQDAYLPCEPREIPEMPYFYVENPEGRLIYRGISDVGATEAVVNSISNSIGR